VEDLIKEVEIKFGEKICNLGSSKRLSNDIYFLTNKEISYNTIRRVYGVSKSNQKSLRNSTLDLLSQYCDYKNYHNYLISNRPYKIWDFSNKIIHLLNEEKIKMAIKLLNDNPEYNYSLLALTFNKLIFKKQYNLVLNLFTDKETSSSPYSITHKKNLLQRTKFCNEVYLSFKSISNDNPILIELGKNKNFVELFIHNFIDYSKNENYKTVLINSIDSEYNYIDNCFKKLYLFNIDYMKHNCQKINKSDFFEINYQKIKNNFVKGRYLTFLLINNKFTFEKYFANKSHDSIKLIGGILPISLVKKEINLFNKIINFYNNKNRSNSSWYNLNDWLQFDIFYIVFLLINLKKKEAIKEFYKIDVWKNSNVQCLDYNWTIYYFVKIILKGPSDKIINKFNIYNSKIFINIFNKKLAMDIKKLVLNA